MQVNFLSAKNVTKAKLQIYTLNVTKNYISNHRHLVKRTENDVVNQVKVVVVNTYKQIKIEKRYNTKINKRVIQLDELVPKYKYHRLLTFSNVRQ